MIYVFCIKKKPKTDPKVEILHQNTLKNSALYNIAILIYIQAKPYITQCGYSLFFSAFAYIDTLHYSYAVEKQKTHIFLFILVVTSVAKA